MTALTALPIFDGHNDTLLNRRRPERGGGRSFVERSDRGHIDLPRAGRFGGGFFAICVPRESSTPDSHEGPGPRTSCLPRELPL